MRFKELTEYDLRCLGIKENLEGHRLLVQGSHRRHGMTIGSWLKRASSIYEDDELRADHIYGIKEDLKNLGITSILSYSEEITTSFMTREYFNKLYRVDPWSVSNNNPFDEQRLLNDVRLCKEHLAIQRMAKAEDQFYADTKGDGFDDIVIPEHLTIKYQTENLKANYKFKFNLKEINVHPENDYLFECISLDNKTTIITRALLEDLKWPTVEQPVEEPDILKITKEILGEF